MLKISKDGASHHVGQLRSNSSCHENLKDLRCSAPPLVLMIINTLHVLLFSCHRAADEKYSDSSLQTDHSQMFCFIWNQNKEPRRNFKFSKRKSQNRNVSFLRKSIKQKKKLPSVVSITEKKPSEHFHQFYIEVIQK